PAIHGHVGRGQVLCIASLGWKCAFERPIASAGKNRIVMPRIDLLAEEPAQGAADHNVAGEMRLPSHARKTHPARDSVPQHTSDDTGIRVRKDAGCRPGQRRMERWKRRVERRAFAEPSLTGAVGRALATG